MSRLRWFPLLAVLVLGLASGAWAGPPTEQLRTYTDQVLKVLQNPALTTSQRREAVKHLAEDVFEVSETAQRALGQHWQQRTPAEREEFVKLFANLLEQTYISRIDEFGGEKLTYVSEQIDGDRAVVRAKITTKNGTDVPVESRLLMKGNRWLIYDILVENLSLAPTTLSVRRVSNHLVRGLVKRLEDQERFLAKTHQTPRPPPALDRLTWCDPRLGPRPSITRPQAWHPALISLSPFPHLAVTEGLFWLTFPCRGSIVRRHLDPDYCPYHLVHAVGGRVRAPSLLPPARFVRV